MQIAISKEELYTMIKSAVREVLQEDKTKKFLSQFQKVSSEEMKDIEQLYGKSPRK